MLLLDDAFVSVLLAQSTELTGPKHCFAAHCCRSRRMHDRTALRVITMLFVAIQLTALTSEVVIAAPSCALATRSKASDSPKT